MQNTPTQGFTYMGSADRPCDLTTALSNLASQLDVKGLSYDTDYATTLNPNMVKVSVTNPTYSAITGSTSYFDTVEYNNGTPTDLTTAPGSIQLNTGYYIVGAYLVFSPIPAASTYLMDSFLRGSSFVFPNYVEFASFAQVATNMVGITSYDQNFTQPNLSYSVTSFVRAPVSPTTVSWTGFNHINDVPLFTTTYYATLWAVQMGQL